MTIDPAIVWLVGRDALWAGVAALGFAILFNVPVRALAACFVNGALGHALRTILMHYGVGIEAATLAGAVLIGSLGVGCARLWKAPAPVFTVPGAITLVPGTFAFHTMLGLLQLAAATNSDAGADILWNISFNATKTAFILAAIAVGIATPTLLFGPQKAGGVSMDIQLEKRMG